MDVLAEVSAILSYFIRLEHMQAKQLVTCLSWKSFYLNSLYVEAYHQMFMLQFKEQMQILNDNNICFRMEQPF